MCLAIPSKVVSIDGMSAVVDVCGARREANVMLLPEEVIPGDYVLVHAGFAMQKVDRDTAEQSLQFFARLVDAGRDADGLVDDEMAEILRRGTISWDGNPGGDRDPA
jgi:hydrogenase expression/formation protein HypC